jgi:hypothetical protein
MTGIESKDQAFPIAGSYLVYLYTEGLCRCNCSLYRSSYLGEADFRLPGVDEGIEKSYLMQMNQWEAQLA